MPPGHGCVTGASSTRPATRCGIVERERRHDRAGERMADDDRARARRAGRAPARSARPAARTTQHHRRPAARSSHVPGDRSGSRDAARRAARRGSSRMSCRLPLAPCSSTIGGASARARRVRAHAGARRRLRRSGRPADGALRSRTRRSRSRLPAARRRATTPSEDVEDHARETGHAELRARDGRVSDIPALDLLGQGLHEVRHLRTDAGSRRARGGRPRARACPR